MGGAIVRHDCGRLIIWGQTCTCEPIPPINCDCQPDGTWGPNCDARERRIWARTLARFGREIS